MTVINSGTTFSDDQLVHALARVKEVAREAGKMIMKGFHSLDANVYHKSTVDLVTDNGVVLMIGGGW